VPKIPFQIYHFTLAAMAEQGPHSAKLQEARTAFNLPSDPLRGGHQSLACTVVQYKQQVRRKKSHGESGAEGRRRSWFAGQQTHCSISSLTCDVVKLAPMTWADARHRAVGTVGFMCSLCWIRRLRVSAKRLAARGP
jgi:hypothetical protein